MNVSVTSNCSFSLPSGQEISIDEFEAMLRAAIDTHVFAFELDAAEYLLSLDRVRFDLLVLNCESLPA